MAIISSEVEVWEDDPVEGLFSPSLLSITYQLQMRSLFDKSNKIDVFFVGRDLFNLVRRICDLKWHHCHGLYIELDHALGEVISKMKAVSINIYIHVYIILITILIFQKKKLRVILMIRYIWKFSSDMTLNITVYLLLSMMIELL